MRPDNAMSRSAVAIVGILALVVAATAAAVFVPSIRAWLVGSGVSSSYVPGDQIDVSPSLYNQADFNLIVFARSSCNGCQRAKTLLRRAVALARETRESRVTLVSSGLDAEAEQQYAREIGVERGEVRTDQEHLRLASVPTLVLVDRDGTILLAEEGIIWSEQVERQSIEALAAALGAQRR